MTFPNKTIYLAGPITGLTHDEARYGWRKEFKSLMPEHIHCNSPMRGKGMLKDFGVLTSGKGYPEDAMTSPSGITTRDFNDVRTSDCMIACFLESGGKLSGGTFMEYGFAHALRIPILGIGSLLLMPAPSRVSVNTYREGKTLFHGNINPVLAKHVYSFSK